MKTYTIYITILALLLASCGSNSGSRNRGPIVLGDSGTIITETDSQYLKDDVLDIEPRHQQQEAPKAAPGEHQKVATPAKDTTPVTRQQPEAAGQGIDLGGARLVLAGLKLKEPRRQNPVQETSLTYSLQSGKLGASKLIVYGGKNITVKQRYQSRLLLKSELGTVDLRELGLYTSAWTNISAGHNGDAQSFSLSTLNNAGFSQVNNNKIKNAADRELRKRRTNSRTIQSWMKEIHRTRSANDEPCEIELDNVQWQISGTDEKGKPFHKTIRVDA
ncbi:hypothetical protein [Taibaiella koreensis]|uniref:hypothetical protein n=1 Tax=Taibaiella koreensis TaxID=1268548 RepID=UPI000E59C142|nr:hypothetical protein [Taibaiella koreensis]